MPVFVDSHTPYEFGVKVTIATASKERLVVGMRSMPGNPWDGHTLHETLEQVGILANRSPKTLIVKVVVTLLKQLFFQLYAFDFLGLARQYRFLPNSW